MLQAKHIPRLSNLGRLEFLYFSFQNVSISRKERECYMDLRPFMNPCPYTLNEVSYCLIRRGRVFREIHESSSSVYFFFVFFFPFI